MVSYDYRCRVFVGVSSPASPFFEPEAGGKVSEQQFL